MKIQLKTNYLANDFASTQTNNTCDNSKLNFKSTFRFSKRENGSWLAMKGLTSILEALKPKSIINAKTAGEFSDHLLVSFSKDKDAEVMKVLQNALANEDEIRCNNVPLHDLTEQELSALNFDRMPVYHFVKPVKPSNANPFNSAPIRPAAQPYAMAG